ncbi:MAG: PQQ-binding-like beta-propeller repeat protein [Bacteroidetes bacterium]|nr:PQQ-binding-like beta-propeller repeat protein [Bacteroidota bacterium]
MKKAALVVSMALLLFKGAFAQKEEFPLVWESDFENKSKVLAVASFKGDIVVASDENEATALDGTGKKIWAGKFKEITGKEGANKAEYQYILFDPNLLFLFDKKMGKDHISVIDVVTGQGLWTANEYQDLGEDNIEYINEISAFLFSLKNSLVMVDARTGRKIWETDRFKGSIGSYLYLGETKEIIMINYKPSTLGALFSGFKNQLIRVDATNGQIKWEATYRGFVEKEVVTRKPLVKIYLRGDKVAVQLDGLQVFDAKTGSEMWHAVYETDQGVRQGFWNRGPHGGKILKGGMYGVIAPPLFTNDAVYLVMGSDKLKTKFVEKREVETGKLLWASEKITGAMGMPALFNQNGKVIAQIGGLVNKQTVERVITKDQYGTTTTTYYNYEWDFIGSYGIVALDEATGNKAWRSEKFDKRISNLILSETMVYAGSGDEFYGFDIASGEMKINVDHSKGKVGKTMWAFDIGENIALVCDNGMAAYSKKDGTKLYNTDKFRGVTTYHMVGNNFFLRKEKENSNTIAGVDLATGAIKGILKSKGKGGGSQYGDGMDLTSDGEYIFSFKGKGVDKYKVNK